MREPSSATLGLLFFVSHMFRMSLFFLITGFFGRMLIERRGTAGVVRDRAKRVLLPLVVASAGSAHRQIDRLLALERRWITFITAASALTVLCLWPGGITPRWEPYLDDRTLLVYAAAYLAGVWCSIFGLIGMAVRYWSDANPVRRYIADSSYFLYIAHLPVLALFAAGWSVPGHRGHLMLCGMTARHGALRRK
jgi:hypothetical protein